MNLKGCDGIFEIKEDGSREKVSFDDPRLDKIDWSTLPTISEKDIDAMLYESLVENFGEEIAKNCFDLDAPPLKLASAKK